MAKPRKEENAEVVAETTEVVETEITEIPTFRDEQGHLFKLRGKDFPKNKDGKLAYCDYWIEYWNDRKKVIVEGEDPKTKKEKRLARLRDELAKLEKELAGE